MPKYGSNLSAQQQMNRQIKCGMCACMCVCVCVCVYNIHTMEYYSAIKKWKCAIFNNMDGLGGHYAKWNKTEKDKYHISFICGIPKKEN